MTIKELLQSLTWINISKLESACNMPKGTIRLDNNKPVPDKYIDIIYKELSKASVGYVTGNDTYIGLIDKPVADKPKELVRKLTNPRITHPSAAPKLQKHTNIAISSEWSEDFAYKVIKLKDTLVDNTLIEIVDGNGLKIKCYSKGNILINSDDNLPQKWTYLPKVYITN